MNREEAIEYSRERAPDRPASVYLEDATALEAVLCDVEREAGDLRQRVTLLYLDTRLAAVVDAASGGEPEDLRGELVLLAAAASERAARLPRPVRRRRS